MLSWFRRWIVDVATGRFSAGGGVVAVLLAQALQLLIVPDCLAVQLVFARAQLGDGGQIVGVLGGALLDQILGVEDVGVEELCEENEELEAILRL